MEMEHAGDCPDFRGIGNVACATDAVAAKMGLSPLAAFHLLPHRLQEGVNAGDHPRVAHSGDADRAAAGLSRPFELDTIGRRGVVAAPLHFHPTVAQLGEDAIFQVQHAARTGEVIGVGFFVERVGGGRGAGEAALGIERFQHERIAPQGAQHAVGAGAGGGSDGPALQDLSQVQRQGRVVAQLDRPRGEVGGVVAAAGQDHLALHFHGLHQWFAAHLGDDVRGRLDGLGGKRRDEGQGMDLAGLNRGLHHRLLHVGVDHGHAEGKALLAGDLGDDLGHQARCGAAPAPPAEPTTTGTPSRSPSTSIHCKSRFTRRDG